MPGPIARPPVMRGLCARRFKIHSVFVVAGSVSLCLAIRYLYQLPKKRKYEEFYKTVDPYKMVEHMCKRNLLHSCPQNIANKE